MQKEPTKGKKASKLNPKLKPIVLKNIKGYDNYAISSEGHIYNRRTGRTLRTTHMKGGYEYEMVTLSKNSIKTTFYIKDLIEEYFNNLHCRLQRYANKNKEI